MKKANRDLLVWSDAGSLRAHFSPPPLPPELELGGRRFLPLRGEAAWSGRLFWDAIRDSKGRLIGISVLPVTDEAETIRSSSLIETRGVICDGCSLDLILCDAGRMSFEGTQGFPVLIYQDGKAVFFDAKSNLTPIPELGVFVR